MSKGLIVDDDKHILVLLKATLARAGYAIVEAASAREALNAGAIDKPDLILLDLGLPDRDGLELVSLLTADPACRLIVISAREETEQKVAALDLGAVDFVTKPFDTDELLARIRAALRPGGQAAGECPIVRLGAVTVDLALRIVRKSEDKVHLTPKEYAV